MKKIIYKIKYYFYKIFINILPKNKRSVCLQKKKYYFEKFDKIAFIMSKINGVNNIFEIDKIKKYNIDLHVDGDNNEIIFGDNLKLDGKLIIDIHGNNNKIHIGNIVVGTQLFILAGFPTCKTENSLVEIGDMSRFVNTEIMLLENNSKLTIGQDCMFAEQVKIHLSDTHSITDLSGNLINYGGTVEIGDRVWACREVKVLKRAKISNDTVIAANSIVSSVFNESNVILAGIPAKIIKRDVKWSCTPPQIYKDNVENCKNEY